MPVTEWYVIKSLTIPSSWVAVLFALVLTGIILWRVFGKDTEEWYSDAAILFLVVWKLSVVITDFNLVIKYPLMILYFNGGDIGVYLGLVVALTRLMFKFHQRGWLERDYTAMVIMVVLLTSFYQMIMIFLNEAELWQKITTGIVFTFMALITWAKASESHIWRIQLTILLGVAHIFVALLQPEGIVQTPIFVTGLFITSGVTVYILFKKNGLKEEHI